jgi:hypothetical protein
MIQAAGLAVGKAPAVGLGRTVGALVAGTVAVATKEATIDGNGVAPSSCRLAQPANNTPTAMRHIPIALTRIHILLCLKLVAFHSDWRHRSSQSIVHRMGNVKRCKLGTCQLL